MRIDCHAHGDPNTCRDPKAYIESCRARGIDAIVLIEPLKRCLEAVKKFGDFVIPVAFLGEMTTAQLFRDGWNSWQSMDVAEPRDIEECINAGCKGIKFVRPSAPYGDERYWPLYQKLEELNGAAIFHTGYLVFFEREEHPVLMEHMRAAQVEAVARRFPDLKILMAHFSNPWWEEAWKVSSTRKNVYADLSGGTAIHRSTKMWTEMFAPDGNLLESSIKKICFGSDVGYFNEGYFPFEPYITFYEKIFERIGLSEELRELVNCGNAKSLFNLE